MTDEARHGAWELVDRAIRRTLRAPCVQFILLSEEVIDDGSWSGEKVLGSWRTDATELFTKTTVRTGPDHSSSDDVYEHSPSFSLIRAGTRTTWKSCPPLPPRRSPFRQCCLQRIEGAPSEPEDLVRRWRTVIEKKPEYDRIVPAPPPTPFEVLADLRDGGFGLFDPLPEFREAGLYGIKHRGVVRFRHAPARRIPWQGYVRVDSDELVTSLQLEKSMKQWNSTWRLCSP